jgi:hypothetical protein
MTQAFVDATRKEWDSKLQKSSSQSDENSDGISHQRNADQQNKKKRRRTWKIPEGKFIYLENVSQDYLSQLVTDMKDTMTPEIKLELIEGTRVHLFPSDEERRKIKKQYREEYNNSPKALLKKESKSHIEKKPVVLTPEECKYKRAKARGRRLVLKKYIEANPNLFNDYMSQNFPQRPRKKRRVDEENNVVEIA